MSAYETAHAGLDDEGFVVSGGSAWFGRMSALKAATAPVLPVVGGVMPHAPGTAVPVPGNAVPVPHPGYADPTPVPGTTVAVPGFADPTPLPYPDGGPGAQRLVVISAGLGQPSTARILADRLAEATRAGLARRGHPVAIEVLELRDLALDIAGAMVAGFPGAKLRAALDAVEGAHGLIAVSPVYTASYSGLFKSFFDVLDKDALIGKPTLIAATGGTSRHSLALDHALRPMFAYLRAFIVPTAVFAAPDDWSATEGEILNERIERAGGELSSLMSSAEHTATAAREEYVNATPYEQRMTIYGSEV